MDAPQPALEQAPEKRSPSNEQVGTALEAARLKNARTQGMATMRRKTTSIARASRVGRQSPLSSLPPVQKEVGGTAKGTRSNPQKQEAQVQHLLLAVLLAQDLLVQLANAGLLEEVHKANFWHCPF